MDNSSAGGSPTPDAGASWGPRRAVLMTGAVIACAAGTLTTVFAVNGDVRGAVLMGVIAALCAVATAHGALVRPRLTANPGGVTVRTVSGAREVPWTQLDARLVRGRRLGRDVETLELDVSAEPPALYVFGTLELGADPRDVHAVLERVRAG